MDQEIYSDGIGNIILAGGVVRIDFVSLSANAKDDSGNPTTELRQRVVLSIEGFARSLGKIQDAANAMIKAGLIQRSPPDEGQVAEEKAEAHEGKNATTRSPPFP
ncbi:MAG: hypothetical protein JOZ55_01635 [Alphaproteobacteria bacterium]|nr:hypothetical protein [Alphaproteobacteria bacterium]